MKSKYNKEVYKKVAEKLGYSPEFVEKVHMSYFKYIKDRIAEIPIFELDTKEKFDNCQTSFLVSCLGKFYICYRSFEKDKENYVKYKEY